MKLKKDKILTYWPKSDFKIFDLEFTSWSNSLKENWSSPLQFREIVEFGVINVTQNKRGLKITDNFNFFIKPKINPELSSYFIKLTGIEQEKIENFASDFYSGYEEINKYMSETNIILCNGNDGEIFRENCILNGLKVPKWTNFVYNVRPYLSNLLNIDPKQFISCDLPKFAGINFEKRSHNAIDDCISIALSIESWIKKGFLN